MCIVKAILSSRIGHVALVGSLLALAVATPPKAQTSKETEHSISVKLLDAATESP